MMNFKTENNKQTPPTQTRPKMKPCGSVPSVLLNRVMLVKDCPPPCTQHSAANGDDLDPSLGQEGTQSPGTDRSEGMTGRGADSPQGLVSAQEPRASKKPDVHTADPQLLGAGGQGDPKA